MVSSHLSCNPISATETLNSRCRREISGLIRPRFSLSEALHSRPTEGTNFDALDFQLLFETGDYVVQSRQFESDETLFRMSFRVEVQGGTFRVENRE